MFRFLFVLILLIFSLFSDKLDALEVDDLYKVTVAVESQTIKEREQAIAKALQGVFLKVGGKKSVLQNKQLLKAKKKPNRFVNKYRYQRKDDELSLVVNFNENKVNALFNEANLPLWGSLRPQVLLWLIEEQGPSRNIIAYDDLSALPNSINQFSKQRGLPIVLPLMDLTDREQVFISDFWGYFPEQIQQASSRYFADKVVVMRLSDSSLVKEEVSDVEASLESDLADTTNKLTTNSADKVLNSEVVEIEKAIALDWKLYSQGVLYIQRYQGTNKEELITQALSDITELIYQSYALSASTEDDFLIDVKNVSSLKSDKQLFDFLTDLSAVKAVTLVSAQGDLRRFKLELLSSTDSFLASLKLNNQLTLQRQNEFASFDDMGFTSENSNASVVDTFNHAGMKVVVLGLPTDINEDNAELDNNENLSSQDSDILDIDNGIESDNDLSQPKSELPVITPVITPVMTPVIPVFNWEQG